MTRVANPISFSATVAGITTRTRPLFGFFFDIRGSIGVLKNQIIVITTLGKTMVFPILAHVLLPKVPNYGEFTGIHVPYVGVAIIPQWASGSWYHLFPADIPCLVLTAR